MSNLQKPGRTASPSPSDFPIGSAESRAAARALASTKFPLPPNLVTVYAEPVRDPEGNHMDARPCACSQVEVDGVTYHRGKDECMEAFADRLGKIPNRTGRTRLITLSPD